MGKMTAAHKTLPFDTVVEVRNLDNGKKTVVRINDRGPFAKGRIIDLSQKAAREIDMIGPGTAKVKLKILKAPEVPLGVTRSYTIQVGAFREKKNAEKLAKRLAKKYDPVDLKEVKGSDRVFFRVRVGRASSNSQARELAKQLEREKGVETAVVVRLK